MTGVLYRLAKVCIRRRFVVLGIWVVVAIVLVAVSHQMGETTNNNLSLPGTGSQNATDALAKPFPTQSYGSSPIVIHTKTGKLTDSKYASAINTASSDVGKAANVASVVNPLTSQGASQLSKDQSTGYISVTTSVNPGTLSTAQVQDIIDAASGPLKAAGLEVQTGGQLGQKVSTPSTESSDRAAATAAGAVFFAGATVTIALVSLAVAGIPLVTTMGLMAAIAVVVAVLGALTLLPAVLAIIGPHINSGRVRDRHPESHPSQGGLWAKWAHEIASHPLVSGLLALAILIPLMIPFLSLNLGQQDIGALSTSTTARQAYDQIADSFGEGVNGPLLVAVKLGSPAQSTSDSRLTTLQKDVKDVSGVAAVSPVVLDKAGTTAFFNAIATTAPSDTATANLVTNLRDTTIRQARKGTNMTAYVGGQTAAYVDLASKISSKLPLQIAVVIVLAFLLLMLDFRTIVVPAQAALMNLLSIAASYGVLV